MLCTMLHSVLLQQLAGCQSLQRRRRNQLPQGWRGGTERLSSIHAVPYFRSTLLANALQGRTARSELRPKSLPPRWRWRGGSEHYNLQTCRPAQLAFSFLRLSITSNVQGAGATADCRRAGRAAQRSGCCGGAPVRRHPSRRRAPGRACYSEGWHSDAPAILRPSVTTWE